MGKDATGKRDADSPTKEMYSWRNDYGAFIPNFKCYLTHYEGFSSIWRRFHFSSELCLKRFVLMNKTCSELIHVRSRFAGVAYLVTFRVWLKTVSVYLL
jgi:hypothetical protein